MEEFQNLVDLFVYGFQFGFSLLMYVGFIPAALSAVWNILEINTK